MANTTKLDLDLVKELTEADYSDSDLIIIDGIKEFPVEGSLLTDMVMLIMCTSGRMQLDINNKTFNVYTNDLLICPPNVYIDNYMFSINFDSKIIGLSYNALQRMLHVNKDIWNMVLHIGQRPVIRLDDEQLEMLNKYYALLRFKLCHKTGTYYNESMRSLFQPFFFDLTSIIETSLPGAVGEENTDSQDMKPGDALVEKFLRLLANSQGHDRSVTKYAEKLYVSPKYLSTMCKQSTGKTALEWIHEYTMEVITQRLKYTDKSVKEIAYELNFPNLSFFGKFVKSRTGMSPLSYRKQFCGKNKE